MQYLLILVCAFLSCTKVTTQGFVAKENVKCPADAVILNCLVFACTAIVFSLSVKNGIDVHVVPYAILFGVFSSAFQIFYALALEAGPFSATCMLVNLNMVVPVLFSCFFFNEKLTAVKLLGMVMCFLALFLNTQNGGKKMNLKWIIYVFLAFFSTGAGISITQKLFAKSQYSANVSQYVFLGYLVSFLTTGAIVLFNRSRGNKGSFKVNRKNILFVVIIAVSLGLFQRFNTYANSFIDAIVLNPSVCGLTTMLQMLSGRIIFKEKFTKRKISSICVGIAAILIISL